MTQDTQAPGGGALRHLEWPFFEAQHRALALEL
jgi:hypothetical protein